MLMSNLVRAQPNQQHIVNLYVSISPFFIAKAVPKEGGYRFTYAKKLKNKDEIELGYSLQGFHQHARERDNLSTVRENTIEGKEISVGYNFFYENPNRNIKIIYISVMVGRGEAELETQDKFPSKVETYKIKTTTFRLGAFFRKTIVSGFFHDVTFTLGAYLHYLYYDSSHVQESGKNNHLNLISPSALFGIGYSF